MAKKDKNKWAGVFIGPILTAMALAALWKNETRFDYHRAATKTTAVNSIDNALSGQLISYTGTMDRQLTMQGDYVDSFTGFMTVYRSAEIYAWEKEDDDDGVTWNLRWMSSVESNSRNSGIRQLLSSKHFVPEQYEVNELTIDSQQIEFVDSYDDIPPPGCNLRAQKKPHRQSSPRRRRRGPLPHAARSTPQQPGP